MAAAPEDVLECRAGRVGRLARGEEGRRPFPGQADGPAGQAERVARPAQLGRCSASLRPLPDEESQESLGVPAPALPCARQLLSWDQKSIDLKINY